MVEEARREAIERGQRLGARSDRIRERVKAAEANHREARRAASGSMLPREEAALTAMRSAAQRSADLAAIGAAARTSGAGRALWRLRRWQTTRFALPATRLWTRWPARRLRRRFLAASLGGSFVLTARAGAPGDDPLRW
jgi:hypothetical protein